MRYFIPIILVFCCCSSNNDSKPKEQGNVTSKPKVIVPVYTSKEINSDINLVNTANRKIAILYNSVDSFLQKNNTTAIHFLTECIGCEPVQPFKDHLIFAGQMEIFTDKTSFHKEQISAPISADHIRRIEGYGKLNAINFSFSGGKGTIKHVKQSCSDAEVKEVILSYKNGEVKLTNVLNASFFEFDLDKDGQQEQFVLANRNCSRELAIIRIF